jgi:hypothetical protein
VSVSNAAAGAQGLPNVDPIYTWVRLAQLVPLQSPKSRLVSGMTATVTIRDDVVAGSPTWLDRARANLADVLDGPTARPGCIPAVTTERGPTQSIPLWEAQPTPTPEQINPGLAPDVNASPQYKLKIDRRSGNGNGKAKEHMSKLFERAKFERRSFLKLSAAIGAFSTVFRRSTASIRKRTHSAKARQKMVWSVPWVGAAIPTTTPKLRAS